MIGPEDEWEDWHLPEEEDPDTEGGMYINWEEEFDD